MTQTVRHQTRTTWLRVRRVVLRRRRSLSALCAAGAVLVGVRSVSPPPPSTVTVLTASRDLPSGTVLGGDDLVPVELPAGTAPDGLAARRTALGGMLAAPLRRGEPLTDVRLVGNALLRGYPGLVAVPVRIPDGGAVRLLEVGMRIDVIASDPQGGAEAVVVAHDAPVLALPGHGSVSETSLTGGVPGGLVVLGASENTARKVADAGVRGYLTVTISR